MPASRKWPAGGILAACAGLVLAVGYLDYATGLEISASAFYLLPIGLATWLVGRRYGLLLAVFSLLAWFAAQLIMGAVSRGRVFVHLWNSAVLLVFYFTFVWLLSALKESREGLEEKVAQRTAALEAAQARLIQAAKMESLGLLAAGVVHEVKNPLQTILTGLDELECSADVGQDPEAAATLRDMRHSVRKASTVLNELLVFSRPGEALKQPASLNALIDRALSLLRHDFMRRNIKVVCRLQPDLPSLPLDRNKIEQALINLFTNAIQAMPQGGSLTVTTGTGAWETASDWPARKKPDTAKDPGTIWVNIDDTGPGISEENLARVFDPFFTTKPAGAGTGLGLYVVRQIIEMHSGTVELTNRPEGGTRCTIRFAAALPGESPTD
jgi:signal transduction histidine kinase